MTAPMHAVLLAYGADRITGRSVVAHAVCNVDGVRVVWSFTCQPGMQAQNWTVGFPRGTAMTSLERVPPHIADLLITLALREFAGLRA